VGFFVAAVAGGDLTHDGDGVFARHIANARRKVLPALDDDGRNLFTLTKDRPHSPNKIDAAMAGVIASEARRDCIAKGLLNKAPAHWFMGV
jgi:phage terminase large subunit-like protein